MLSNNLCHKSTCFYDSSSLFVSRMIFLFYDMAEIVCTTYITQHIHRQDSLEDCLQQYIIQGVQFRNAIFQMVITTASQPNPTNKAMVTLTNQHSTAIATTLRPSGLKSLKKQNFVQPHYLHCYRSYTTQLGTHFKFSVIFGLSKYHTYKFHISKCQCKSALLKQILCSKVK